MASIRRGYSDDFTLKNNSVGIGTSTGQEALDVVDGAVKGQDLKVTGIASFTAYEGFLRADHQIAENTTLSFDQGPVSSLSGEIIVGTGVTVTIASVGLGTTMVGNGSGTIENTIDTTDATRAGGSEIECLKVYNTFTPPSGGTNERPYAPKPGELYYNYDFKTIEFFDGYGWRQVDNTTRSGRAALGGGSPSTDANIIQYINIHTTGNSSYFGDLTRVAGAHAGFASATRGISGGGAPGTVNIIDYITIASAGNAINFGDLTVGRTDHGGCSSSTRGLWGGGYNPSPSPAKQSVNVIDYVEIATLGDALDFGDLTIKPYTNSGCASPTRGIFTGGFAYTAPSPGSRVPEFNSVTIASKGNALDFGDPLNDYNGKASCSNSVRGVHAGGNNPGSMSEMGSFIIASFGSFTEFGDLSRKRSTSTGVSTKTRGVFAGGVESFPTRINTIDYITFSSAGNAIDFGELIRASSEPSGMSDSHGGLGGF